MNQEVEQSTILVVDDTPANIDVAKGVLSEDYRIQAAVNGPMALKVIEKKAPDLILLDIMMPEMDGYEVCRRIKENESTRDIPIIFLTAKAEVEDETKGLSLGAVDYITKPISPPILKERVRTHLELRKARLVLEEQNRELIKAAELRDDVDRIMRHDLKGPLTIIIGMPDLIAMDESLSAAQVGQLNSITDAGYRMLNMINMSLDMFKMERGMYNLNPQPKLLSKLTGELKPLAEQKGQQMELLIGGRQAANEDTSIAMGEELLAISLFSNLLKNSIEAAPADTTIRIAIDTDADDRRIKINNKGSVPVEIRDRFFEKYVTAGKEGGTGLGTYSARLMADTLKGAIELDSSEEGATTISVWLPAGAEKKTPVVETDFQKPLELPSMRVLVVDDDAHSRNLIVRYLEHPSLTVESVNDGADACTLLEKTSFDLVFMDIEMPGMGGLEAIGKIRAREKENGANPTPIIALSGHDDPQMNVRILEAGFTGRLGKPVAAKDLFQAIENPSIAQGAASKTDSPDENENVVMVDPDFKGMVEDFIEENRISVDTIIRSSEPMNNEEIRNYAHTLAGSASMYGLAQLSKLGKEVETAAKDRVPEETLSSLMNRLAMYLNRVQVTYKDED